MSRTLFIGNYYDGNDENYLIFVAQHDCDREAEFKKAYAGEYGDDNELDDQDIRGVFPIKDAYDYTKEDRYAVSLCEYISNARESGDDCPKCGNPSKMYWCADCESNQEKEGKCDGCGHLVSLDRGYHDDCN